MLLKTIIIFIIITVNKDFHLTGKADPGQYNIDSLAFAKTIV